MILIILIISAVALPVVLPAFSHRQVSEAARIVQGAFIGAHDNAVHNNQPSGIRLLPDPVFNGGLISTTGLSTTGQLDPTQILACNRIIPIDPAPEYAEGYVSVNFTQPVNAFQVPYPVTLPGGSVGYYSVTGLVQPSLAPNPGSGVLMVEESFYAPPATAGAAPLPNPPTSWFWNIRVGDKIQINNAGPWYTVVGPMVVTPAQGNSEMFVNVGQPGALSPLVRLNSIGISYYADFLFLVNGQDDNGNGWVDEGWDGVNNNQNGTADELLEWQTNMGFNTVTGVTNVPPEAEQWLGSIVTHGASNVPYTISRRPAPSPNAREVALPTNVVIDLTSWGSSLERSRFPAGVFNHYTGYVDIVVNPDGSIVPTTIYSSPSTFGLSSSFIHLWLAERGDLVAPSQTATMAPYLPLPASITGESTANQTFLQNQFNGAAIKGEYRLLTIFTRTGQSATLDTMPFDLTNLGTANYNTGLPYVGAQQGISGGP